MIRLADRMSLVSESITLAVSAKANALKKQGVDVVAFGAGEPDFDTPQFIKESAKAALESDARVLAFEAGRAFGVRVNVISAGPWPSRAANAVGSIQRMIDYCKANSPLPEAITAAEVGAAAAFLCSPLGTGITGTTLYVDKGFHAMGMGVAESWFHASGPHT